MNEILLGVAGFLALLITGAVILFKLEGVFDMLQSRVRVNDEEKYSDKTKNFRR